jgi:FAD/FMN-containing dehydrogenase
MTDIVAQLRQSLGDDAVLDRTELSSRARNHWDPTPLEACALVRPRSTQEISSTLRICHMTGQHVVVHGGLTGACDGDRSTNQDVVLSLERMTMIEEVDPVGRTATVQAGCPLQKLQEAAEDNGLYFPLDLGARGSCTVGGNAATNAGGTNVIRYGMMRALILGLEAVLADGTVISAMNHMLKNNTGYDLKQLFIGSEGTLGVVTRLVVALKARPASTNTALVAVDGATNLLRLLSEMDRRLGGALTSFEAMWGDYYRAVTSPGWHVSPLERGHEFYIIVEARGPDPQEDARRFGSVMQTVHAEGLIVNAVLPKSESERELIWSIRENFEPLKQRKPLFGYDVSLPLRQMFTYIEEVTQLLLERWPQSEFFALGHIADGNLHFFISPHTTFVETATLHAQCDEAVYRPLQAHAGAISAEHGIGLQKKAWLGLSRSEAEIELMKILKRTLDPMKILNTGKVIDV